MKFSLKPFLLITFILLEIAALSAFPASSLCCNHGANADEPVFTNPKIKLIIEIYFGRPRRDCNESGLCKIAFGIEPTRTAMNGVGALYTDEAIKNRLILELDKAKGITEDQYRKYFSTGTFVMGDDFPVPDDVAKQLGISTGKIIPAGKYPVTDKAGILFLSFPLK